MAVFYTVDSQGRLYKGLKIALVKYRDVRPTELQVHIDAMFPEGVTSHGELYFLRNASHPRLASPQIELVFEYVRRAMYPHRPSRLQSFFAFESLTQAVEFRRRFRNDQGVVWMVEADKFFQADMHLLTTGTSILLYSYFAGKYWKGEPGPSPFWEVLLAPPVSVLCRLEELSGPSGAAW
jgi:hypothetical protein